MFRVREFMTADPITITGDEKISSAIDLMKFNKIHRIPVVNADDKLVGLITEGRIAADNQATSLSIYELNYLLSKTDVRTVMAKHPISIHENALLEEATEKLLKHDIGCLPVVNDEDKVVGILTQNDIFKAFLDMLDYPQQGTRLVLDVPQGVGVLEKVAAYFAANGVSLSSVSVYNLTDDGAQLLIKTPDLLAEDDLREGLNAQGFELLEIDTIRE